MYWPKIDNSKDTKCIFKFIEELINDLVNSYDRKLNGEFLIVDYTLKKDRIPNFTSLVNALGSVTSNLSTKEEILSETEQQKDKIVTKGEETYKFIISSEKNYYRLFEVTMSEYFPVKIYPLRCIETENDKVITAENIEQFKNEIIKILNSTFVRNLVTKMIDNLK